MHNNNKEFTFTTASELVAKCNCLESICCTSFVINSCNGCTPVVLTVDFVRKTRANTRDTSKIGGTLTDMLSGTFDNLLVSVKSIISVARLPTIPFVHAPKQDKQINLFFSQSIIWNCFSSRAPYFVSKTSCIDWSLSYVYEAIINRKYFVDGSLSPIGSLHYQVPDCLTSKMHRILCWSASVQVLLALTYLIKCWFDFLKSKKTISSILIHCQQWYIRWWLIWFI